MSDDFNLIFVKQRNNIIRQKGIFQLTTTLKVTVPLLVTFTSLTVITKHTFTYIAIIQIQVKTLIQNNMNNNSHLSLSLPLSFTNTVSLLSLIHIFP